MYDELIKRLRETSMDFGESDHVSVLLLEAVDAIEELEFVCNQYEKDYKALCAYLPKWIPVTERLPEEKRDGFSKDVLMLVENPDGDITWRDIYVGYYLYDATSTETGWWTMMTCNCAKVGEHTHGGKVFPANEYVTHWMPLPEPPEEDET